jgi:hypothetical protein
MFLMKTKVTKRWNDSVLVAKRQWKMNVYNAVEYVRENIEAMEA